MRRVAVMANSCISDGLAAQTIDNKYLVPITEICQAVPIIIPTCVSEVQIPALLDRVDGIILTGDASNVFPPLYDGAGTEQSHGPFDRHRDSVAFELIGQAMDHEIPLLGICRGIQEINVAFGGTLRNDVYQSADFPDHAKVETPCVVTRYGPAHEISVRAESRLGRALGCATAQVNSLHEQAIDRLASDLVAVATSSDGLIEAVEHVDHPWLMAVQWHAEYDIKNSPASAAVFEEFAKALL